MLIEIPKTIAHWYSDSNQQLIKSPNNTSQLRRWYWHQICRNNSSRNAKVDSDSEASQIQSYQIHRIGLIGDGQKGEDIHIDHGFAFTNFLR